MPRIPSILMLLLLLGSMHAHAFSGRATDNAFAALFSMPGAGPQQGYWNTPPADGFTPGTEPALIVYLGKQQKAGADFNAYRHSGTLLHHAIRAGRTQTSLWLLQHGADPHKLLRGSVDNALDLSLTYKRTTLTAVLRNKYGMKPKETPTSQASIPPSTTPLQDKELLAARGFLRKTSAWAYAYTAKGGYISRYAEALEEWTAYARRLPPSLYWQVIDNETSMANLIRLHSRSAPALDRLLAGFSSSMRKRHAATIIGALVNESAYEQDPKTRIPHYRLPATSWQALWRHLDKPLDYSAWPHLAGSLQPELWPELHASGYRIREAETALGCLMSQVSTTTLHALWPRLEASFPDIRSSAPRMVLSDYRLATDRFCWAWDNEETSGKLRFLTTQGINVYVGGINQREMEYVSADLLSAMQPFITAKDPIPPPRLVEGESECQPILADAMYRELLSNPVVLTVSEDFERVAIDTVQMIAIPGEPDCALLVGGGRRIDGYIGGATDTFTGPVDEPTPSCPDPMDRYEIWHLRDGAVERLPTDMGGDDGAPDLIPVKDNTTGKHYYLHSGEQYGRCHGRQRLPFALEWRRENGKWALRKSSSRDLQNALFAQCSLDKDEGLKCRGISSAQTEEPPVVSAATPAIANPLWALPTTVFLRTLRKSQLDDYLAAIMALDRPMLKRLQAAGIPGDWTAEAIRIIGKSDLPLFDKRKRTAWIFYDRQQLSRALDSDVLSDLLTWLPREDWRPVLSVVSENNGTYYGLEYLREEAEEKGLQALACDIDNARGLNCGETWETREP